MDRYKSLYRVSENEGISIAELLILDLVRMKTPLPPLEMSRFAVAANAHRPELLCNQPAFEAAIETLVQNRCLRLLAKSDLRLPLPSWSAFVGEVPPPPAGVLDFTQRGHDIAHRAVAEIVAMRSQ
jgi:hypothetical protein